jgi:hypothetical protein
MFVRLDTRRMRLEAHSLATLATSATPGVRPGSRSSNYSNSSSPPPCDSPFAIPLLNLSGQEARSKWQTLAATGLNDMQIIPLDDALFLFAFRKVQETAEMDLPATWSHYQRYWRERLVSEAFTIIEAEYHQRMSGTREAQRRS